LLAPPDASASASVFLGHPASAAGIATLPPVTSPQTTIAALDQPSLAALTAKRLGLPKSAVSGHVALRIDACARSGMAPVLAVTVHASQAAATIAIANAYAQAVADSVAPPFVAIEHVLKSQIATAAVNQRRPAREIAALRARPSASPSVAIALASDTAQLAAAQATATAAQASLAAVQQTEMPRVVAPAGSAAQPGRLSGRWASIILAGLVGAAIAVCALAIRRDPSRLALHSD